MRLGAHLGIGRGFRNTAEEAVRLRLECLQIFVGNPRGWQRGTAAPEDEVAVFRAALAKHDIGPVICHSSYLVNLAAAEAEVRRKSIACATVDLRRAARVGATGFVVSGGSRGEGTVSAATRRMAAALRRLAGVAPQVTLLIENTCGGGRSFCSRVEELAGVVAAVGGEGAVGVCLDTCHAHVAGYDLSEPDGVADLMRRFERSIGLARLGALHLNDARYPCGSHRDAHAHIGEGTIGRASFRALLAHPELVATPGVIETPKEGDADRLNLRRLRQLRRPAPSSASSR